MKNLEEFYILGLPIETEIGECKFIKVKDYPNVAQDLSVVSLSKDHIINLLCTKQSKERCKEIMDAMGNSTLFEVMCTIQDIKESYVNVLMRVFNEDSLEFINEKNFDFYRNLVLKMNCQKEEKINPNPEIQRAIERSRRVKASESEPLTFSSVVTSIVGYNGLTYEDINEFTIYQLYMTFYRISQFKNYDTSTLFATVAPPKSKIESWSKHINMFEEEKHFVDHNQFKKTTGSAFE